MDIEVIKVPMDDNGIIYVLLDADRKPIEVVAKYMKYLYNSGKAPNTLKGYCQALKAYFTYLGQLEIDYSQVSFDVLSNFVGWLSNPYGSVKVTPQKKTSAKRAESTVNNYITVVMSFYDYLYRSDSIDQNIVDKVMRQVFSGPGGKGYKSFLEHVRQDEPYAKNTLKKKEPRKRVEIFTKEQVEIVYNSTTNIRDRFLIRLLFEMGMRIGEALSLFSEDLKFDNKHRKHQIHLTERGVLPNGGYLKTGERKIDVSQELMDLYDDYLYEVIDDLDLDHNFVFVKLFGGNLGSPMEYHNVRDVCEELKKKTGFHITPHMFRHTHGTLYYLATKNIKMVQERLGHSQIQTTIKYYLHPSEDDIRKDWEKKIVDETGNIFRFRNHAFRHTYAVKMINGGADILTVQELLAHASPEMTMRYAKLVDDTKRKEFEKVVNSGVFSFDLDGKVHQVTENEEIPEDIMDALWRDEKLNALDNPYGTCRARVNGNCPLAAEPPCLTANNGKPCFDLAVGMTSFDVKKYELHIESTTKMIEAAKEYGREDMIEANKKNLERYQDIYNTIKSGSVIFGNLERMQRKLERMKKKGVKNG